MSAAAGVPWTILTDDQVYAIVRALQVAGEVYKRDAAHEYQEREQWIQRAFVDQAKDCAALEELFAQAERVELHFAAEGTR